MLAEGKIGKPTYVRFFGHGEYHVPSRLGIVGRGCWNWDAVTSTSGAFITLTSRVFCWASQRPCTRA
jgi:hypothetical protein